jgi:drug/metabolite transporter (DMT)-like permease
VNLRQSLGASRVLQGIGFVAVAVACFSALDTTTKFISTAVPVALVMWVRFVFQTAVTTAIMAPRLGRELFRTRNRALQAARGAALVASSSLAFFSLQKLPVAEFTAIVMLTPLLITLFAASALRERVGLLRWALVLGGFVGAMLVIRPTADDFNWAMLLALSLVAVSAVFQVLTSRLALIDDPATTHFYTGCVGALFGSLALPFMWAGLPAWPVLLQLLLIALFSTLGHFLLIMGYARAPVAVLTPYLYLQIAFAIVGGWWVFGQAPDRWELAGIALIAACGAAGTWVAARRRKDDLRVMLETS